jgi:hypothetical protein
LVVLPRCTLVRSTRLSRSSSILFCSSAIERKPHHHHQDRTQISPLPLAQSLEHAPNSWPMDLAIIFCRCTIADSLSSPSSCSAIAARWDCTHPNPRLGFSRRTFQTHHLMPRTKSQPEF